MSRPVPALSRIIVGGLGAILVGLVLAPAPGAAQSSTCSDFQKTLAERRDLIAKLNSFGKKKATPREACDLFSKIVTNGASGVKWIEANKEWCSVPDNLAEGFKADHTKAVSIRGQACSAAAQQAAMEKKMRQQQGGQGGQSGGLLGGPGLTGTFKVPQGAL